MSKRLCATLGVFVLFAACAFALLPRSYEWLIMGGGLTRSLGLLFAMAVLAQAVALYRSPSALRIATAGILAALAVLTHLEMGLFLIYSLALFFLVYGRTWRGLRGCPSTSGAGGSDGQSPPGQWAVSAA